MWRRRRRPPESASSPADEFDAKGIYGGGKGSGGEGGEGGEGEGEGDDETLDAGEYLVLELLRWARWTWAPGTSTGPSKRTTATTQATCPGRRSADPEATRRARPADRGLPQAEAHQPESRQGLVHGLGATRPPTFRSYGKCTKAPRTEIEVWSSRSPVDTRAEHSAGAACS